MSNETPDPPQSVYVDGAIAADKLQKEWVAGRMETPEERAERRFFTAATGRRSTDEQVQAVVAVREAVLALAVAIDVHVPAGRNKSLAQTALEDVHMRANRGIFDPEAQR